MGDGVGLVLIQIYIYGGRNITDIALFSGEIYLVFLRVGSMKKY